VDATTKAASPSPVIFKKRLANAFFILAHHVVLYSFKASLFTYLHALFCKKREIGKEPSFFMMWGKTRTLSELTLTVAGRCG
jgi:hypothetical protein